MIRRRLHRAALLAAVLAVATSCQALRPNVDGSWKVVRWSPSGISVMFPHEANAWIGKRAHFDANVAMFDGTRCTAPTYIPTKAEAHDYLTRHLGTHPKDLGITRRTISIVEVHCNGKDWIAPGNFLILKDSSHLVTLWDGVFFELARSN